MFWQIKLKTFYGFGIKSDIKYSCGRVAENRLRSGRSTHRLYVQLMRVEWWPILATSAVLWSFLNRRTGWILGGSIVPFLFLIVLIFKWDLGYKINICSFSFSPLPPSLSETMLCMGLTKSELSAWYVWKAPGAWCWKCREESDLAGGWPGSIPGRFRVRTEQESLVESIPLGAEDMTSRSFSWRRAQAYLMAARAMWAWCSPSPLWLTAAATLWVPSLSAAGGGGQWPWKSSAGWARCWGERDTLWPCRVRLSPNLIAN